MQKSLLTIVLSAILSVCFLLTSVVSSAQTGDTRSFGMLATNGTSTSTYDSLLANFTRRNVVDSYENFVNEFINVDLDNVDMTGALPDSVYANRLKMMATEIQLPYNEVVKKYIMTYTKKGGVMERVLGLGQFYFPIFEETLYRYDLPMELKMMPVIEAALIPRAKSYMSASGLWQFMLRTGKYYGLEINTFVDERCDPIKSTEAACKFLRDMYKIYGDWTLVIASYNCGQGNVNKALERHRVASGGSEAKTYWDIYEYLPRETRGYVPAFIAASYAYTYYKAHDLDPTTPWHPLATDTVHIKKMLHFEQVSSTLNIPIEVLRGLNPQYSMDIIPAKTQTYVLTLPQEYSASFVRESSVIHGKDSLYLAKYLNISNLPKDSPARKGSFTYKVKSGDVLGRIAERYNVSLKKLMAWNNIRDASKLRLGQRLTIYQ